MRESIQNINKIVQLLLEHVPFHWTDAEFMEYFEWLFSKVIKLNLHVDFQEMFGAALYCLDIFSASFRNQSICCVCNESCLFDCVAENIQFSHHLDRFINAIQPVVSADIWYVGEFEVNLYLDLAGVFIGQSIWNSHKMDVLNQCVTDCKHPHHHFGKLLQKYFQSLKNVFDVLYVNHANADSISLVTFVLAHNFDACIVSRSQKL